MHKLVIISRYNEDLSWTSSLMYRQLIYNKGNFISHIESFLQRIEYLPNLGGNQRDICKFCLDNYDDLPDISCFIQAYPFDHCKEEIFYSKIKNNFFTELEYYGAVPGNSFESRDQIGGYMEINNNWYIQAHNNTYNKTCIYQSFDEFMHRYFSNYTSINYIRFSPGSQYIVPKENILKYPKIFWFSLMNELNELNGTTAHIVERSLWYIFTNAYEPRTI